MELIFRTLCGVTSRENDRVNFLWVNSPRKLKLLELTKCLLPGFPDFTNVRSYPKIDIGHFAKVLRQSWKRQLWSVPIDLVKSFVCLECNIAKFCIRLVLRKVHPGKIYYKCVIFFFFFFLPFHFPFYALKARNTYREPIVPIQFPYLVSLEEHIEQVLQLYLADQFTRTCFLLLTRNQFFREMHIFRVLSCNQTEIRHRKLKATEATGLNIFRTKFEFQILPFKIRFKLHAKQRRTRDDIVL